MLLSDTDQCGFEEVYNNSSADDRKIFLSRIPSTLNEESIRVVLEKKLGEGSVEHVALTLKKDDNEGLGAAKSGIEATEHRGFAFVTLSSKEKCTEALSLETIRAKAKEGSKRKHTIYIRPIVRCSSDVNEEDGIDAATSLKVCFLWTKFRCPYGDECKFSHVGDGGCEDKKIPLSLEEKKKKQKCFTYKTRGKCKLGDACPYSHNFEASILVTENSKERDLKEKDCISWKTKGKCRKGDACLYRHDDCVRDSALEKKQKKLTKKRGRSENPQPLSIRVFGLNYETKESDVREYFQHCGLIKEITFPTFEDSGRSKGYCGILFTSPKATEKACELDGQELHGRWLSVQAGKMYLKQWSEMEEKRGVVRQSQDSENERRNTSSVPDNCLSEFGQKVKKRKKHGYKDDNAQ